MLATSASNGSYFQNCVIFMVECSEKDGAWGLIINNPVHMPLDEVFKKNTRASSNPILWDIGTLRQLHTFFFGGPVQNTTPFQKLSACILEVETSVFNGAYEISRGVFISRIPLDMALPVSRLIVPQNKTARMFFGYSGWAPGQLENEILNGVWEISNPVPFEVFSKGRDEIPITATNFRERYESFRVR